MKVEIHNTDQSLPMIFEGVDNTYIKDGFFCLVWREKNIVHKYPICRIFRVIEPYDPLLAAVEG
jgi:hypothetical protein